MQTDNFVPHQTSTSTHINERSLSTVLDPREGLLDSWKEIANFFGRDVRTVQLWEKREGLPVHRHFHIRRASVHAYCAELQAWQRSRRLAQGSVPAVRSYNIQQASAA